jgi:hypothetical protein
MQYCARCRNVSVKGKQGQHLHTIPKRVVSYPWILSFQTSVIKWPGCKFMAGT